MRLSTIASAAIAMAASANADFWLVAGHIEGFGGPVGESGNHWLFVPNLDCGPLTNTHGWSTRSDVSGNKQGVRVKYVDDGNGGQKPSVVEMHTDKFHDTWYADRDGNLVDLGGNVKGHCDVNMDTDKKCDLTGGYGRYQSLLFCTGFDLP